MRLKVWQKIRKKYKDSSVIKSEISNKKSDDYNLLTEKPEKLKTGSYEEEKKSFKLHKKITKDNSPNALSANKHKENRLFTPIYIAKTRRLNKYNSESSIIKKELIIDTRSNISNKKVKKNKSKKFSFEYFRRKKYENYHVPFKIQITNSNKKRNSRNKFYIEDNEITSNDPTENNNMNSYKTKFQSIYIHLYI